MTVTEQYIATISLTHRKTFNQFYTSPKIAQLMIHWLLEKNPQTLFDPAFGMGSFYDAAKNLGFKGKFIANEIDKHSFDFYTQKHKHHNLELLNIDYFSCWGKRYDAIICNPPYSKFQKISNRSIILSKLSSIFNTKISGYTNIASAFLLKSISELNLNGRLAYIMPLEFLNTGYGKIIKRILLDHGTIREIIHIKDEDNVFESVTTTVCIIFFEKKKSDAPLKFSIIEDIKKLTIQNINNISLSNIDPENKWLVFFEGKSISTPQGFVPLSFYGKFKRDIATGANNFFILTKEKISQLKLKDTDITICLTKSNQIKSSIFTDSDLQKLINNNSFIYIFNPNPNIALSPEATQYIKLGETLGYNNGYLTKNRKTWFYLEKRISSPILFSVFSRDGYKIIRNQTDSLNLTCYHGFEPNLIGKAYIDKIFIFLKSELGSKILHKNKRKYGGNLDKFEPSDLNTIFIPSPAQLDLIPEERIIQEMNHLKKDQKLSIEINNFFNNLHN